MPTIRDLLGSTQGTQRAAMAYVENSADREKAMLALMVELEKVNQKGAPILFATIGEGSERLVVSTIPHIVEIEDNTMARPTGLPENTAAKWFNIAVSYPAVSKNDFLIYYDHFQGMKAVIEANTSYVDELLNPFNMTAKDHSKFPVYLRELSSRGKVRGIDIVYQPGDSERRFPIFSFGREWIEKDSAYGKGVYFCMPESTEIGMDMQINAQTVYRDAIEARRRENRGIANTARNFLNNLNEKRKRR